VGPLRTPLSAPSPAFLLFHFQSALVYTFIMERALPFICVLLCACFGLASAQFDPKSYNCSYFAQFYRRVDSSISYLQNPNIVPPVNTNCTKLQYLDEYVDDIHQLPGAFAAYRKQIDDHVSKVLPIALDLLNLFQKLQNALANSDNELVRF
jgi:hypothetical protein